MTDQTQKPPREWVEALERAEAELASGQTVPWDEVRRRVLEQIAAFE